MTRETRLQRQSPPPVFGMLLPWRMTALRDARKPWDEEQQLDAWTTRSTEQVQLSMPYLYNDPERQHSTYIETMLQLKSLTELDALIAALTEARVFMLEPTDATPN